MLLKIEVPDDAGAELVASYKTKRFAKVGAGPAEIAVAEAKAAEWAKDKSDEEQLACVVCEMIHGAIAAGRTARVNAGLTLAQQKAAEAAKTELSAELEKLRTQIQPAK